MTVSKGRDELKNKILSGEGKPKKTHTNCLFIERCLNYISPFISMNFKRKPVYSKKSTLKLYLITALSNLYIETVVTWFKVLGKLMNGHGVQSGDTALNRIEDKHDDELLREARAVNRAILHDAKKQGAFRGPIDTAIDYHKVLRFTKIRNGSKRKKKCDDLSKAIGIKSKSGAHLAHFHATIEGINIKRERYTLDFAPVHQFDNRVEITRELLKEARRVTGHRARCNYADGDFDHIDMINMFKEENENYVVRMGKNEKVKKVIKEKMFSKWYHTEKDFVIGDGDHTATTNLVIIDVEALKESGINISEKGKKDRYYTYGTNQYPDEKKPELEFYIRIARGYSHRWGIETGYAEKNVFLGQTHSLYYSVRLWQFLLAIILYNLWLLIRDDLENLLGSIGLPNKPTKYLFLFLLLLAILLDCADIRISLG